MIIRGERPGWRQLGCDGPAPTYVTRAGRRPCPTAEKFPVFVMPMVAEQLRAGAAAVGWRTLATGSNRIDRCTSCEAVARAKDARRRA